MLPNVRHLIGWLFYVRLRNKLLFLMLTFPPLPRYLFTWRPTCSFSNDLWNILEHRYYIKTVRDTEISGEYCYTNPNQWISITIRHYNYKRGKQKLDTTCLSVKTKLVTLLRESTTKETCQWLVNQTETFSLKKYEIDFRLSILIFVSIRGKKSTSSTLKWKAIIKV